MSNICRLFVDCASMNILFIDIKNLNSTKITLEQFELKAWKKKWVITYIFNLNIIYHIYLFINFKCHKNLNMILSLCILYQIKSPLHIFHAEL